MTVTKDARNRLRSADRAVTRQLLIEAGIRVFKEVGYVRATVDRIATEAGASRATFYLHFRTKAELIPELSELAGTVYDPHYADLGAVLRTGEREVILAWVTEAMRRWASIKDLMGPVYEAAGAEPGLTSELFSEDVPGLTQMQEALDAVLPMDSARSALLAEMLFAPLLHFFNRYLRGQQFDHAIVAELIADSWVNAASQAVVKES